MARLNANTVITAPGQVGAVVLMAGNELPEWAEGLVGPHLLDDDTDTTPVNDAETVPADAAGDSAGTDDDEAGATPDESWTVADLREYAKTHDVDLHGATSKADILTALGA